jgi:hypothetical protein
MNLLHEGQELHEGIVCSGADEISACGTIGVAFHEDGDTAPRITLVIRGFWGQNREQQYRGENDGKRCEESSHRPARAHLVTQQRESISCSPLANEQKSTITGRTAILWDIGLPPRFQGWFGFAL